MRNRRIAALAVGLMTFAAVAFTGTAPAFADPAGDEAAFVAKINALRASKGLPALQADPALTTVARSWSLQMANAGAISHTPDLAANVTADWQKLGENVGVGGDVQSLFDAFVASPSHYKNLVDPDFRFIGVGVVMSNGRLWTAHEFMTLRSPAAGSPAAQSARRAPAPRAAAPVAAAPQPAPAASPQDSAATPVAHPPAPKTPVHTIHSLAQLRSFTA